jgi:hypothetical protein
MTAAKPKDELLANPAYLACKACGDPVHHRSPKCRTCTAPSPWLDRNMVEVPEAVLTPQQHIENLHKRAEMLEENGFDGSDLVKAAAELERLAAAAITFAASRTHDADVAGAIADEPVVEIDMADIDAAHHDIENGPHVFMSKFTTQIGSVMCHFMSGQVVEDHIMLGQLRELGAPMVPVVTSKGMVCCPKCKTIFPAKSAQPKARSLTFARLRAG